MGGLKNVFFCGCPLKSRGCCKEVLLEQLSSSEVQYWALGCNARIPIFLIKHFRKRIILGTFLVGCWFCPIVPQPLSSIFPDCTTNCEFKTSSSKIESALFILFSVFSLRTDFLGENSLHFLRHLDVEPPRTFWKYLGL